VLGENKQEIAIRELEDESLNEPEAKEEVVITPEESFGEEEIEAENFDFDDLALDDDLLDDDF
jgi:hypothetical protein